MRQKCTAGRLWGILYPPLLYVALMYLVQILIMVAVSVSVGGSGVGFSDIASGQAGMAFNDVLQSSLMLMNAVSGLAVIPVGAALMYADRQDMKTLGVYRKYTGRKAGWFLITVPLGLSAMLFGNSFVSCIEPFLPQNWINSYEQTAQVIYDSPLAVQLVASAIIAPVAEEIIFRGLVYRRIRAITGTVAAMILSALMFAVFHGNIVQGIYAFIMGLALAFVYEKFKSLLAPVLLHITANGAAVLFTYMSSASGQVSSGPAVYPSRQYAVLVGTAAVTFVLTVVMLYAIAKNVKLSETESEVPAPSDGETGTGA